MQRRHFLAGGLALLSAYLAPGGAWANSPASRNSPAFNARSPASVYAALGLKPPRDSDAIRIVAPDVAENGANIPVEIQTDLPQVERILLIGERNLFPLLADASFNPRLQPWFEARIKLAETSKLHVLVQANGQLYSNSRTVRVILGGCLPG